MFEMNICIILCLSKWKGGPLVITKPEKINYCRLYQFKAPNETLTLQQYSKGQKK